jgi:hypothetical protein
MSFYLKMFVNPESDRRLRQRLTGGGTPPSSQNSCDLSSEDGAEADGNLKSQVAAAALLTLDRDQIEGFRGGFDLLGETVFSDGKLQSKSFAA